MSSRSFPIGRILIAGIELFALILFNVFGYFALKAPAKTDPYDLFAQREREFDRYPVFSGTVTEIESCDVMGEIVAAQEEGWQPDDPNYKKTDSVAIGPDEIGAAHIKVSGLSGSKWFNAGYGTYVYGDAADGCGGITISKGQHINIVYDNADTDQYTRALAVKGNAGTVMSGYIVCFLVPSIIIFVFTILLMNAVVKRKTDEKPRGGGVIALSVVMIVLSVLFVAGFYSYLKRARATRSTIRAHAPVIYIYDESDEYINLQLELNGELTCTYPEYDPEEGWTVNASPDGTMTDLNGDTYRFLFWEADLDMDYNLRYGYCVKGSDTEAFLEDALATLGLNETEASDFMGFWLPLMENNPYNVITFQTTAYTDAAELVLDKEPDVEIRVNMLWYASDEFVDIEPQELNGLNPSLNERHGLVVSEWGGEVITKP